MAEASHSFDAIVLGGGGGIAGFSAALALREKGKRVAVVFRGSGASSVSSGAWDFRPIPTVEDRLRRWWHRITGKKFSVVCSRVARCRL